MIATIHDLSQYSVSNKYGWLRQSYIRNVLLKCRKTLSAVIAVSQSTKHDIQKYWNIPPDKISVIPNGFSELGCKGDKAEENDGVENWLKSLHISNNFILYVSRIEHPGKNHIRLIRAFELLRRARGYGGDLVLAGADWNSAEEVHDFAKQSPNSQHIKFTGFIEDTQLLALYKKAQILVMPSLYEGFGIPIVEAMNLGIPVACSNVSSMPEIIGKAGLLFDPYDEKDISEKMHELISNAELRHSLIADAKSRSKQFEWKTIARRTIDAYKEAVNNE